MIVQHFTSKTGLSPQDLLTKLQSCNGLLFLTNNTLLTVGVFPKWQLIANNQQHITKKTRLSSTTPAHAKYATSPLSNTSLLDAIKQHWQPQTHSQSPHAATPRFTGGLMGYISYDFAAQQQLHHCATQPQPQAIVAEYDIFLQYDNQQWTLYGPNQIELQPIYQHIIACLKTPNSTSSYRLTQPFTPIWSYAHYQKAFSQVQDYLRQGDCYQVNLTQPYQAISHSKLLNTLDTLLSLTQAPYAGYLTFEDFEVLSCSPELFIQFNSNGEFITQPIKGTRPRHHNSAQDAALKQQLIHSEKDRSENLMIVDLLRNDFSRHAKTGSVSVPALFEVHSFAQVHHMVSEIRATLKDGSSALDVLFSALPGGSITGAPKIRAMQIIEELEAQPRGAYCGSMGYLNDDGSGSFNILIRTLQRHGDTVIAWAGGGITIASRCEDEYQECQDKIGAILDCLNQYVE